MISSNKKKAINTGRYEREEALSQSDLGGGIREIIESHELWLSSGGSVGGRAVFMHADFSGFDFQSTNLSGAVFKNCNLAKCSFSADALETIDFYGSNLRESIFTCKKLVGINFEKADISGAHLSGVKLYSCKFIKCVASKSESIKSSFIKTTFISVDFRMCNFHSSVFTHSNVQNANFNACDFSYTKILNGNFSHSSFGGSEFHSTELIENNFQGINFKSYKSEQREIKTVLKLTKFINCKFVNCQFEESERELKAKMIKVGIKKPATRWAHIYNIASNISFISSVSGSLAAIICLAFFSARLQLITTFAAALHIFISSGCYLAYFYNVQNKILKQKNAMESIGFISKIVLKSNRKWKFYSFVCIIFVLPVSALAALWIHSLSFQIFISSIMHFLMFFYSLFFASFTLYRHKI